MEGKQALAAGGSFAWRGAVLSVRLAGPIRESSTSPGAEEESKSKQEPHGLDALDIPDHARTARMLKGAQWAQGFILGRE